MEIGWSDSSESPFSLIDMSTAADEVSLTRLGPVAGTLRVNLRWKPATVDTPRPPRRLRRAFAPPPGAVDLDLGCLYEFTDGRRGVVQAVGRRSGDYARFPFLRLDRDDRIGGSTGENVFVNMDHSAEFQRILFIAMLASGSDDITTTGATVTVYPAAGPALELRLEGSATAPVRARSCAVVQIRWQGSELVLRRELRYFSGYQSEIDAAYDWGLRWGPAPGKTWF